MHIKSSLITALFTFCLSTFCNAQANKPVTEYLGIGKTVVFDKVAYDLTWTSHPQDNFYKEEYLGKGDNIDKFKKLVMFDLVIGDLNVKDVVANKVAELEKLKATNPVVNYNTYEHGGEVMLDFLISENTEDGKHLAIVERNVYRYKQITDKNGVKGILLFAVAERSYGDDIDKFFPWLKKHKMDMVNAVGAYVLPEVVVGK